MPDSLARLRALVDAAFAPVHGADAAAQRLARLDAELAACFAELLAADAHTPAPFAALTALADAARDRSRTLPPEVERAHFDWLRRRNHWYKPILGPDGTLRAPALPPGEMSVPLELVPRLYRAIGGLRYAIHRRRHPAPCDCAALVACGAAREPRSPDLRRVGPECDGYYLGDLYRCGSCGARWFRGVSDDDVGAIFWEPWRGD